MPRDTNERLHTEEINGVLYRVIRRPSGAVQVWVDYPPGQSAGWPENIYSGDLEGARNVWRQLKRHVASLNSPSY